MRLVDTHCHLQSEKFDADREEVLSRSLETLEWLVLIGNDLADSRAGVALTRDRVYAAAGIHPYYASHVTDAALAELRELARNPRTVAIGECGLDYYKYNETPRDAQYAGFRRQLELAAELGLPVVIHNRDADADTYAILEEMHKSLPGGVMHCFSGTAREAGRAAAIGFYVSFAGNVTYPKAQALRDAAKVAPVDRLLVETDAPYLAPQPVRGKRCEPRDVAHTVAILAETLGMTPEELARVTTENAARLFRVGN